MRYYLLVGIYGEQVSFIRAFDKSMTNKVKRKSKERKKKKEEEKRKKRKKLIYA